MMSDQVEAVEGRAPAAGELSPGRAALEREVAALIVSSLNLELDPADIVPEEPLFGEGLGLDSIDALELSLAISQRFGFELKSDDERNKRIFGSLRSLAAHIDQTRQR